MWHNDAWQHEGVSSPENSVATRHVQVSRGGIIYWLGSPLSIQTRGSLTIYFCQAGDSWKLVGISRETDLSNSPGQPDRAEINRSQLPGKFGGAGRNRTPKRFETSKLLTIKSQKSQIHPAVADFVLVCAKGSRALASANTIRATLPILKRGLNGVYRHIRQAASAFGTWPNSISGTTLRKQRWRLHCNRAPEQR